jgi:hypothetical protein
MLECDILRVNAASATITRRETIGQSARPKPSTVVYLDLRALIPTLEQHTSRLVYGFRCCCFLPPTAVSAKIAMSQITCRPGEGFQIRLARQPQTLGLHTAKLLKDSNQHLVVTRPFSSSLRTSVLLIMVACALAVTDPSAVVVMPWTPAVLPGTISTDGDE